MLSEAGIVGRSSPPLSAEQIIEHEKVFFIRKDDTFLADIREFMLHAFV